MHACLVLLPASSILLWCTGGLLYGVLLHGVDLCNSLSGFLLNPDQQENSQIRVDLLPCPAAAVSSALTQSTTQALFNLTRAANTIIEGSVLSSLLVGYALKRGADSECVLQISTAFQRWQPLETHLCFAKHS